MSLKFTAGDLTIHGLIEEETTFLPVHDLFVSMAPRFSSKVAPQNSPVWRVLAISRVGDRLLRFLAVGHGVSGSAEWDWRWRAA
jgi:hypothetical protein